MKIYSKITSLTSKNTSWSLSPQFFYILKVFTEDINDELIDTNGASWNQSTRMTSKTLKCYPIQHSRIPVTFHLSTLTTKNNLRLLMPYSPQICPNVCTDHYNKNQMVK